MIYSLIALVLIVGVDQTVKYWARLSLQPIGTMPLINGLIEFRYVQNTGAAFSLLMGKRWLLIAVTAIFLIGVIWICKKQYFKVRLSYVALVLIVGGAIGNLVDRILFGYVVDMFNFTFLDFAIFNPADIFISVGCVLMAFSILFLERDKGKETIGKPISEMPAECGDDARQEAFGTQAYETPQTPETKNDEDYNT